MTRWTSLAPTARTGPRPSRRLPGIVCAAVLSLPSLLAAQETSRIAPELGPEESVRLALENGVLVRAAAADAAVARAMLRQARAALRPSVQGQAAYTRLSGNIPDVEFAVPGADSSVTVQGVELDRYQAELSVTQPLLTSVRLRHEARAARHEAAAAERAAAQELAQIAFDVRRAYWELYGAREARDALETARARVGAHLETVRERFEAGSVLLRDVLAAETRRSEVELERVEADNAVRVAELELNRLIGLPLDAEPVPVADVEVEPPPRDVDALIAEALASRPGLEALEEQVAARRAALDAVESRRIPELDFVGRYLYARPNPYFFTEQSSFRGTWELGFAARWDIWRGGRQPALEAEAEARLDAADARLAEARDEVAVDVARRRLEVRRAVEAVSVASRMVAEAEESFRVVGREYEEGAALASDLLDAEETLRRARARLAAARAEYEIAEAALLAALGRIR